MAESKMAVECMKNVFLFCATGQHYQDLVSKAIFSIKFIQEDSYICVYTDKEMKNNLIDELNILDSPQYNCMDKITVLKHCKHNKCVFLDCDTLIVDQINDIWSILDKFDMAVAQASWRISLNKAKDSEYILPNVPEAFPEFNTGVIAFNNTNNWKAFLNDWESIFIKQLNDIVKPLHDQPAFRLALWQNSNLLFFTLPPEYNFRCDFPSYAGYNVKILHALSGENLEYCYNEINKVKGARVFIPNRKKIESFFDKENL
jgi:hypothetical protein